MGLRHVVWALLPFILLGCFSFSPSDDEWTVLTAGLPTEIKTSQADKLLAAYVLKQTHEPLFRRKHNQSYISNILDDWSRSDTYDSFKFCISNPKSFNTTKVFDSDSLLSFIKEKLNKFKIEVKSIVKNQSCVEFILNSPNKDLLFLLSSIENAPTASSNNPKIEDGLGSFRVEALSDGELLLFRKAKRDKAFNSIRFVELNSPSRKVISEKNIEDFNYVPRNYVPAWVKEEYANQEVTFLATGLLVLNLPDIEIRKKIFNCLDIENFRQSIVPVSDGFVDVASILPVGIKGAIPGKLKQNCGNPLSKKVHLTLKIWEEIDSEKLKTTLSNLSKVSGLEIDFKTLKYNEILNDIHTKNYDLMPVLFDTKMEITEPFFEPLADSGKRLIKYQVKEIDDLYQKLLHSEDKTAKESLAIRIQKAILDNMIVIPLLQKRRILYYPKRVKGIILSDDFLEFPDVGKIEL